MCWSTDRRAGRLAAAAAAAWTVAAAAWAQVPDNRGLGLDPDDVLTPAYGGSLEERERQRLEEARETGGSFVPTAHGEIERPDDLEPAGGDDDEPERPGMVAEPEPEPVYERYKAPAVEPLAVPEMLDALIEAWNAPPAIARVRYPSRERAPAGAAGEAPGGPRGPPVAAAAAAVPAATAVPGLAAVRPGDGVYARAVYAIDSDYPGPVFLEVLEPPLAGARLTGAFTRAGERLVLRVTGIEHRGVRAAVEGWAVGLDCACYGVGGAVDRHWFERVLLPAAVNFAQGFLSSAGRPEESVRIDGAGTVYERRRSTRRQDVMAGVAGAVGAAGEVLLEGAPTAPTVRIPRDAELAVVFAHAAPTARAATAETPDE